MTTPPEQIVALYRERKQTMMPVHSKMMTIKDQYNNEVTVPLPELDKNETVAVANLVSQGVDQLGMRIASTLPSAIWPAVRPGIEKSEDYARIRRLACYGWWQANRFDRKQRKRAKWLVAYAVSPVILRPDFKRHIPLWQLSDPLCTFPSPMADPDDICPDNAILGHKRHLSWLQAYYPQAARSINLGKNPSPDTQIEVIEYIDGEEHVMIAIGRPNEASQTNPYFGPAPTPEGLPFVELERFPNRVGKCTLVYPSRPSLECPISQFDGMPGVYRMQARAMALFMIATQRAIFPEAWVESHPNMTGEIVQQADGVAGMPGLIRNGILKETTLSSNPQVIQMLEMLERTQKQSASLPSDFGGENPTNVRTGRAGEQLLSATVDFWVQEAQETLGAAYTEENKLAVAIAKTYFGDIPQSFFVNWGKSKGPVDYTPSVHFENDNNIVQWPMVGSDANSQIIGIGQRLGLEEMSIQTAQTLDPYIDDPEEEQRRLAVQSVNKAFFASVDQAVAAGQVGPTELARFQELVLTGRQDPYKAWQALHDEMQQQQASAAQSPPQPGTPEAAPGLSAPGQQAALGLPAPGPAAGVSQPSPGIQHMQQLIGALKQPRPQPTQNA